MFPQLPRVALCAFVSTFASHALAYDTKQLIDNQLDPRLDYETLAVTGFDIHYPSALRDQAMDVAALAERIHLRLTSELGIVPEGRTNIVMQERSDQPTVFTMVSPHRQIFLDLAQPDLAVGINDYANRLEWLVTHEYTHVLHLDAKRGVYRPLSWLVGSTATPSELLPPWLKEGAAVAAETAFTVRGRGDSPRYSMMIRMAHHDGLLDDPAFATLSTAGSFEVEPWPWTLRPYLFGYYLVRTLLDRGVSLADVLLATADGLPGDPLPALEAAGFTSQAELWDTTLATLHREAEAELTALREHELTDLEYLTENGFYYFGLAMAPNGQWLVVTREEPTQEKAILRFTLAGDTFSSPEVLVERSTGYRSSFSRSSRFLAIDQSQRSDRYYVTSDIFLYDLKTRDFVSASPAVRGREPAVHPNGTHIAFVVNQGAKNRLIMTDTAWNDPVDLLGDVGYRRISSPVFSPDGSLLAATVHNEERGGEDLWLVTAEGERFSLVASGAETGEPSFTEDGRYLFFSSDETGVSNVYAWSLETQELSRVSHVLGGVFSPVVSPDQRWIYVVTYGGRGYDVARFRFKPETWTSLGVVEPVPIPEEAPTSTTPAVSAEAAPYSGLPYLAPQYVSPSILLRPDSFQFGGKLGAVDPLFLHHYELTLRYDTTTREPVGRFYYFNGATSWPVDVTIIRDAVPVDGEDTYLRSLTGVIAANIPLAENALHLRLRPGLVVSDIDFRGHTLISGAELGLVRDTEFKQIGQSFPETGSLLSVTVRQFLDAPWGGANLTAVLAKAQTHTPGFSARQALHLTLQAGAYVAGEDPNAVFYTGGSVSFPFELDSEFLIYGYPVNSFVNRRVALGTARYTFRAADFDAGTQVIPFFLGRLSLAAATQLAAFGNAKELDDLPWSAGLELHQELTFSYIFDLAVQLGVYRGAEALGGGTQAIVTVGSR